MPKDNLNKGFVKGLKAEIEKQAQEQQRQAEATYKEMVETSAPSQPDITSVRQAQVSDPIVYAELAFDTAQSIKEPVEDSIEDSTEYAEILLTGYIGQSKKLLKLVEDIKVTDREIVGIAKLKEINQSASDLAVIEETLKNKHDLKLNLHAELLAIRAPLHKEFDENFQRLQKKEAEIEARINDTHGDVARYNQLKSELYNTRYEHIRLIEKKIESEQALHQISQGLKTEIERELFILHQAELGLQYKIQEGLSDEKAVIEQNFQLHAAETPEFKQYSEMYIKTVNKLESCHNRIFILEDEINTQEKVFQSEAVEFGEIGASNINLPSFLEENPCYEQQLEPQAHEATNLPGAGVDRNNKLGNVDSTEKCEEALVEKRQLMGDKKNRVQFTESTIERDDLKEQQKKETSESKKNLEAANPTTFKSRLEEFSTIWQSNSTVDASTVSAQGPVVDWSVKPGPSVNRDLKPTNRLEKSNFFSTLSSGSSSDQEEKQKEKDKKRIAFKH